MQKETIQSMEDVLHMLDSLLRSQVQFWDKFYEDRHKSVPFFVNAPDENLVEQVETGAIQPGKVLELGCGPGRNAIYLAKQGFDVDAVDLSETAIAWARERADAMNAPVRFNCRSVFELEPEQEYDLVYDSGCLHHISPHRRFQYIRTMHRALKPGGQLGLTCFAPGHEPNSPQEKTDWDVYRYWGMKGGMAYSEEKLRRLLGDFFDNVEFRAMKGDPGREDVFGAGFLWATLWTKKTTSQG
ncbi:class I SAM-dependent methyltransferase [Paenibacillus hamazuiensis]|uniref:class I SAM-dependent methyltransferase n=1 Tax=Paenibacillus hamazuiensis TaxID=2936508 RepID=UPI00200C2D2A|nr:class I SAM-dependent methyltransferase [Paenibacillus hamazuiensis]